MVHAQINKKIHIYMASDSEAEITFNRIPISTLLSEIEEEANQKWQKK